MTDTQFGPSSFDSTLLDDDSTLLDDDVVTHDEVDTTEDPSKAPAKGKSDAPRARGVVNLTRVQIRRIAVKAEEVADAEPRLREIAAELVGSGSGLADLTTAIMAAEKSVQPVADLTMIAESDPMEAGVNAGTLGRARLRAVWSLLRVLGAVGKTNLSTSDAKAAIAVAKGVFGLDDIAKAELDAAVALLKKN